MSGISFRRPRKQNYVDLNITSLVDVLFLLLIFFTLTSTFKREGELELQLPESATAQGGGAETTQHQVELVLTAHGTLLVNGAPTTFETLVPELRSLHERQPDGQVTIQAEESVGHGQVVRLLDAVRLAGFMGVSIGVRDVAKP